MPQRNSPNRRAILATRRAAQRSRQPGFTAVPNKRVNGAMENPSMSINDVQREAVTRVARSLPQAAVSYLFRRQPSMNDHVSYRKQVSL